MNRLAAIVSMLVAAVLAAGCAALNPSMAGWETLIDRGSGLDNFNRVGAANWRSDGGTVMADSGQPGFLVTKKSYRDFQIRAEFWAEPTTNSGIFVRAQNPANIQATSSYEVNIFDQRPDPKYGTGAIVDFAQVVPMPKAAGKWNTFEITADGRHLVVMLNGQKTVDFRNGVFEEGHFTLQWGAGVIKFRKVAVKPL